MVVFVSIDIMVYVSIRQSDRFLKETDLTVYFFLFSIVKIYKRYFPAILHYGHPPVLLKTTIIIIAKTTQNLRINFFIADFFVLILVVFLLLLLLLLLFFSLHFGQISPLAFFRWLSTTSDRNAESCNRIPSNYYLP